jgi:plastocyanin
MIRQLTFRVAIAALLLSPPTARADDRVVSIDNFVFTPKEMTVAVGTRITWVNHDDIPHTVMSTDGTRNFRSPPLDTDNKFAITFDRPGTYKYFCSLHPMMTGTIVVR